MQRKPLRAGVAMLALAAAASIAPGTTAPAQEAPPRPSLNLYGVTGLIDMPSAEAQPDAQVSASYSQFGSTSRRNFTFQLLPRISATLRYASIKDWGNSEDPEYKLFDRSLDVQFQILKERGAWQPSVALGFRDVLGTGVYSAEYLVASKTIARDFTVTGGIGWGRLASVGGVTNPFCSMSDSFCERKIDYEEGGTPTFDAMFHGEDMGFFGGVEWRTPIDKLTLKAEISSDAYTREQAGPRADFERKSPINVGAEYRLTPGITLGGYYMYGSTVGINVVVSG
ncbi:MAG TPA: YjbH domain-containing protein, partial [Amaricoccus sp.]|nr:YjbH domain-containing protein [Amaricoccus sp.]